RSAVDSVRRSVGRRRARAACLVARPTGDRGRTREPWALHDRQPSRAGVLMSRLARTGMSLALVLIVSVGVSVFVSFRGTTPIWLFNQGESGVWLDEATAVLDGQVMYRDFFEFVAPGVVYADALMLSIVGRSAFAAQLIPVFVGAILALLVWRISRKLLD